MTRGGRRLGSVSMMLAVAACGGGATTASSAGTSGGEAAAAPVPQLVPQLVHDGATWVVSPDGRWLTGLSRYAWSVTDVATGVLRVVRPTDLGADGSVSDVLFLGSDLVGSCVYDGSSEYCAWMVWDIARDLVASVGADVGDVVPVLLESPRRVASFEHRYEPSGEERWTLSIVPFEDAEPIRVPLDPENLPYQLWGSPDGRLLGFPLASEELVLVDSATGVARAVVGTTPPAVQDGTEPDPRRLCTAFMGFTPEGALALMDDGSLLVASAAGDRTLGLCTLEGGAYAGFADRVALTCGEPGQPVWLDLATGALRPRGPGEPIAPPTAPGTTAADPLADPRISAMIDQASLAREHSVWSVTVDEGEIRVQHRSFADAFSAGGWTRLLEGVPDPYGTGSYYASSYGSTASDESTSYEDTSSGYEDTATGDGEPEAEEEVELEDAAPPDPDADFDDSPNAHLGERCWIGRGGDGGLVVYTSSADGQIDADYPLAGTVDALGVAASVASGCEIAAAVVGEQTLLFADRGGAYEPVGAVPGDLTVVWADRDTAVLGGDASSGHVLFDVMQARVVPIDGLSGTCFFVERTGDLVVWRTTTGIASLDLRSGAASSAVLSDPTACGLAVDAETLVVRTGPLLTTVTAYELRTFAMLATYSIEAGALVGGGLVVRCSPTGLEVRELRTGRVLRTADTCSGTLATDARFLVRTSPWRGRALVERVVDGATLELVGLSGQEDSVAVYASNGTLWVADPAHLSHYALRTAGPVLTAPTISGAALAASRYRPTLLADFLDGRPLPTPGTVTGPGTP